jgi:hypothetical protein
MTFDVFVCNYADTIASIGCALVCVAIVIADEKRPFGAFLAVMLFIVGVGSCSVSDAGPRAQACERVEAWQP